MGLFDLSPLPGGGIGTPPIAPTGNTTFQDVLGNIFAGGAGAAVQGNGPGGIIQGAFGQAAAGMAPAIGKIGNTASDLLSAGERFILDFYTHILTVGVTLIFVVAGVYLMFKPQIDEGLGELKKQGIQAAEMAAIA